MDFGERPIDPEKLLAREFKDELGVDINPQALRMFIRSRWHRISTLSHAIHGVVVTQGSGGGSSASRASGCNC